MLAEIRSFIAVDGERASAERVSSHQEASGLAADAPVWPRPNPSEPIASAATEATVKACFDAFSTCVAIQHTSAIESQTRQMLRPILTSWLNDHLPKIVERLVIAEIQRIALGGR